MSMKTPRVPGILPSSQERPTKSGKKRRGAAKSWGGRGPDAQDSSDEDGNRRTALQADKQRKASEKQAQKYWKSFDLAG